MAQSPRQSFQKRDFYRDLGRAVRLARIAAGKSQEDAAAHIGVSFQQLQKYENGSNRIPVEQLVEVADYLDVSLNQLLSLPEADAEWQSLTKKFRADGFATLMESWAKIKDQPMRAAILNLIKRTAALKG